MFTSFFIVIEYYENNNIYIDTPDRKKTIPTLDNIKFNDLVNTKIYDLIVKEKNNLDSISNRSRNNSNLNNFTSKNQTKTLSLKKGIQNNNIHNYRENRNKKYETNLPKKLDLINMPINKSKCLNFELNKNFNSLINRNQNKNNEKRKNEFFFGENKMEEYQIAKIINSSRNLKYNEIIEKKNHILNSIEKEKIVPNPLIRSNENRNNPISLINFITDSNCNNMKKSIEFNSINKSSKDAFPYINANEREKYRNKIQFKLNLNINNNNKEKNITKKDNKISIKKKLELNNIENNKNSLSIKEKACLILSKSKILNLKEKIIF